MNAIDSIQEIIKEHFTKVNEWVIEQRDNVNSPEEGDELFRETKRRLEEGLRKLEAVKVRPIEKPVKKVAREAFRTAIKSANAGAKRDFEKVKKINDQLKGE